MGFARTGTGLGGEAGTVPAKTAPWLRTPSGRVIEPIYNGPKPEHVTLVSANSDLYPKRGFATAIAHPNSFGLRHFPIPSSTRRKHCDSRCTRFRVSSSCHEDLPEHLGLPRGLLEPCLDLFPPKGHLQTELQNERTAGRRLKVAFTGELRSEQKEALKQILAHDTGVLAASTAFGKTVIAAKSHCQP